MKTVKKLLCLMLVAMMLVSAIPTAFATGNVNFWIELYVDEAHKASNPVSVPAGTNMDEAAIIAYAQQHLYGEYFGAGYSYDRVEEAKIADADNLGAKIFFKTAAAACEHANKTETVTTAATCTADGVKTITCADCGETIGTEAIPAVDHNMVNGVCSVCGHSEGQVLTLTLWADANRSSCQTITMVEGGNVPNLMPYDPAKKDGWTFDHWETASGKTLVAGSAWSASFGTEFFPVYYQDAANDDVSKLNVYVVFYADGIKRTAAHLFTEEFNTSSKSEMFDWLKGNGGLTKINDTLNSKGYTDRFTWDNKTIYNYYPSSNETGYAVTKADMDSNGSKNVCIKVNADAAYLADVFVYIHKAKTETANDMLEMKGYMLGDNITLTSVKNALKNAGYSYKSINMYNHTEWAEVVRGENTTPRDSVEATGTTKIHVYVNGATVNSNADKTNPKTGDMIIVAVTGMALSAAAVVALIETKKRKMI